MKTIKKLAQVINKFEAVIEVRSGERVSEDNNIVESAWVYFRLDRSELAWRTLEFMAWMFTDLYNARYPVSFGTQSPPPFANTPGECLAFTIDCFPDGHELDDLITTVADFIKEMHNTCWDMRLD